MCKLERQDGTVWLLTRYADVRAALADPRLSKDWRYTLPAEARADAAPDSADDAADGSAGAHPAAQAGQSRSFTAAADGRAAPAGRADRRRARSTTLPASGRVDLMAEYAFLLPVFVICELLGVPADDRDDFAAWSTTMVDESTRDESMAASAKLFELPARADRRRSAASPTTPSSAA